MKTVKAEEVNGKAYATLDEARRDIGRFIDTVYNSELFIQRSGTSRRSSSKPNSPIPKQSQSYATTTMSPN